MKLNKLKFLTATLLLILLESCSSNEGLQEGALKTADSQNSFVFDPAYDHYIIDGQLTTDHNQIANAAKDAWNVLYDVPKSRIVISTTPAEFEKMKDNDLDLKNSLEAKTIENIEYKNPNAPIINIEKSSTVSSLEPNLPLSSNFFISTQKGSGTFSPPANFDIAYYKSENDSDDVVLHIKYTGGGGGSVIYFNVDLFTSIATDVDSTVQKASSQNNDGFKVTDANVYRSSMFYISADTYGFSTIINHSKVKKTINVYASYLFGGNFRTIVLNAGQALNINTELTFLRSGVNRGALSIKVN